MAIGIGIGLRLTIKRLLGGIPFTSDSLFWLDGKIIEVEGVYYFKDKTSNGRNFIINNYDFPTNWEKGFPYKSNATISAPVGDAVLIAEDINNYLYDSGGNPNQIPVISLFQDIDYEHKLFCRHIVQIVDVGGVETYEPRICDIVLYANSKTTNDLTVCNSFYGVPSEDNTAKWAAITGNDTTGNGTKTNPYKTIKQAIAQSSSGSTIYVRTGSYTEARTFDFLWLNVVRNIIGVGLNELKSTNSPDYVLQMTGVATGLFKGFTFTHNSENYCISITGAATIEKCRINTGDLASIVSTVSTGSPTFKNCIINSSTKPTYANLYNCVIDTCIITTNTTSNNLLIDGGSTSVIKNNKFIVNETSTVLNQTGNGATTLLGNIFTLNKAITELYTTNSLSATLNFSNNTLISDKNITNALITSPKTLVFNYNIITLTYNFVSKVVVEYKNGTTLSAYGNIVNSSTENAFNVFNIYQTKGTPNTTSVKIYYNRILTNSNNSYTVRIGTENTSAFNETINGIEIVGNYIEYTGSNQSSLHAIFVGHNINAIIKYNYVKNAEYHTVYKHSNQTITSGAIAYNISVNSEILCFGAQNYKVYNNTVYMNEVANTGGIFINANGGGNPTNTSVKNNIIIAKETAFNYILETAPSAVTLTYDKNILYSEDGDDKFWIGGVAKTRTEWLAAGFDVNSYFTNPLLDEETLFPSAQTIEIGAGEDLGEDYSQGLDITTNWGNATTYPVLVLKSQPDLWQIGAYII